MLVEDTRPKRELNKDEQETRQLSLEHQYFSASDAYHYLEIVVDSFRGVVHGEGDTLEWDKAKGLEGWAYMRMTRQREKLLAYLAEDGGAEGTETKDQPAVSKPVFGEEPTARVGICPVSVFEKTHTAVSRCVCGPNGADAVLLLKGVPDRKGVLRLAKMLLDWMEEDMAVEYKDALDDTTDRLVRRGVIHD